MKCSAVVGLFMKPSLRAGFLIVLCMLATARAEGQTSPASELLDPGWDDPFFANYLKAQRTKALAGGRSVPGPGTLEFSLPVLGFSPDRAPEGVKALSAPMRSRFAAEIPGWPQCAKDVPETVTVPDYPDKTAGLPVGTWYATTYDFGCVQVVVEGNRNAPDRALVPDQPSLPESGDIDISYFDENAGVLMDAEGNAEPSIVSGKLQSPVSIGYTRGNLTYDITVTCTPEGESLCASTTALRAVVAQLVTVDGGPSP